MADASDKCRYIYGGCCHYLVDWLDYPQTTGYSMWQGGGNRYGCMRLVARINQKAVSDCPFEKLKVKQLEMF